MTQPRTQAHLKNRTNRPGYEAKNDKVTSACEPFKLLYIAQNDGATAVLVFAHICTAPVLDVGHCTDSVSATCNATANLQNPYSAKLC